MKKSIMFFLVAFVLCNIRVEAQTTKALWVGESFRCDATSAIVGSPYNISWSSSGGYISLSGSGLYRDVTATQFWKGTATVTCSWKYTLYHGGTEFRGTRTWQFTCQENPVSIYPTSMTIKVGETGKVSYSHLYTNNYTSFANAYFSCSSSSVTVSSDGWVTAKSPGTAYVYVYSKLSDASNAPYCTVRVEEGVKPTGVTITPTSLSLIVDESQSLSATVYPSDATYTLSWSSNDSRVASVNSSGVVTAKGEGKATITVKTDNGISATCLVEVKVPFFPEDTIITSQTAEGAPIAFRVMSNELKTCAVACYYRISNPIFTIPSTIKGLTVVRIDDLAFADSKIEKLIIPNSVKEFGERIFKSNRNLKYIKFPDYIENISHRTFSDLSSSYWDSYPDGIIYLSNVAYDYKGKMEDESILDIKEGTTIICENAFSYQNLISEVKLPASLERIDNFAFNACEKLKTFHIPKSVKAIGIAILSRCPNLNKLTVDSDNKYYDMRDNCNALISTSENSLIQGFASTIIPNSVTVIGDYAFSSCDELTSITMPNSITIIGADAFYGCSGLTSVTIPNSVTEIGYSAFSGCSSLTSVTIPNSVTSLGNSVFSGCSGLTTMTIPNSVTEIGDRAFNGCFFVSDSFINNSSLESPDNWGATLCDEETSNGLLIKNNSVMGCRPWVTSVMIPNGVTSIGEYAFLNNSGLTSVSIPNSVTSIGRGVFSGCSGLTSVSIPNSVTNIGSFAFSECSGLTSVSIPNSVTNIGSNAFRNCSALTAITIPNSVTNIGSFAFQNCSGLTSVSIPNSVTSIGEWTFSGCSALTAITIPNSVTNIGSYAFYGCSALTSVLIPNSVTEIGNWAFEGCSSLTDVYCYAKRVPTTQKYLFDNSSVSSATLHVPAASLEMYKAKTPWSSFGKIIALTDEEMPVKGINSEEVVIEKVYDLSGHQLKQLRKGVNILRYDNGKNRKVIVK